MVPEVDLGAALGVAKVAHGGVVRDMEVEKMTFLRIE